MANPRAVKMAKLRENERLNKQFVSLATPAGGYNRGGSPNTYSQMRTPEGGPNRGGSPNTYSQVRTPEGGPNRGGSPNTYSQMRTPEGGSNRGGSGKPKFTRSTVFDESGETLEEINVDENDIKTTTKVFTPATALEQAETAMREEELGYPAGPPNAYDMLSMQEQERFDAINAERRDKEENAAALGATVQELYPTVETFNGPSISKVPSPHLGELEMNGQLSSSMLLANGSNNGRGGNRTKAGTNNEKMVWSERLGRYITMDEYLGVADQFPSAPSDKQAIYNSDLQQWVLETTPALSENDVGVLGVTDEEAYSAQTAMAAELESDYLMGMRTRHPEKFVEIMNNPDDYEAKYGDPHGGEFPVVASGEQAILNKDKKIIEKEITKKIKKETTDKEKEDEVIKAVKVIKEEDPTGIALTTLNDFATYADTVSNKEAVASAKQYLQELKDSPTVTSRFRKAMAIGMLAMLFGDDFTTAMNTGFGVVADDYAEEDAIEKATAVSQAELNKKLAQERRTSLEWDRQKQITFALDMKKEKFKLGAAAAKANATKLEKVNSDNYAHMKDVAGGYWDRLDEQQKKMFGGSANFAGQYARALDWAKNNTDVQWDFKNNNEQVVAFNTQFEKWLQDSIRGYKPPAFANYMQDAFIKTRLEGNSKLSMVDTNPSVSDIADKGIDVSEINWNSAKEVTVQASNKIRTIAGGFNEASAIGLIAKDYYDWKDTDPEGWADFNYRANENGVGGFIAYVNSEVKTTDAIGTMYMTPPEGIEWNDASKSDYIAKWLKEESLERNKSRQS